MESPEEEKLAMESVDKGWPAQEGRAMESVDSFKF
jgi:hypothetical protein